VLHPKSHTVTLNTEIETYFVTIKGAMCKNVECLLKSPYHGFLKMTVHMVWNIALGMKTSCKDLYLKVHRI